MKKTLAMLWQKIEDGLFSNDMVIVALTCTLFVIAVAVTVI